MPERPHGPPAQAAPRARRHDIEALRLLASLGIVWFHTRPDGGAVAYGGLVAFLILSIGLGCTPGQARPIMGQACKRAQRLLLPWAFWFLLYGLWNASQGAPVLPSGGTALASVMAGPSIHLWYLPFIFVVLVGLDVLHAHARPAILAAVAAVLALAAVVAVPLWRPVSLGLAYPALQWADAVAPVLLGLFLVNARVWPVGLRHGTSAALLVAMALMALRHDGHDYGIAVLVGFAAVLVVESGHWAAWRGGALTAWSDCSFGLYLAHSGVWLALARTGWVSAAWMPLAIFAVGLLGVRAFRAAWPALANRVT